MIQKTIREISDAWRENKRPYVKQSTLAAYMLILEDFIFVIICHNHYSLSGLIYQTATICHHH